MSRREEYLRLEWMPQNPRVSDEVLLQALLEEHAGLLENLAEHLLKNQAEARQAVSEAFTLAIAQRSRYWGQCSLRAWLLGFLFQACWAGTKRSSTRQTYPFQHFEGLSSEGNLMLALRYFYQLAPAEIACALEMHHPAVQNALAEARYQLLQSRRQQEDNLVQRLSAFHSGTHQQIQARLDGELDEAGEAALHQHIELCPGCRDLLTGLTALHEELKTDLGAKITPRTLTSEELNLLSQQVLGQIEKGPTRRHRSVPLKEALWIGLAILSVVILSLATNLLAPDPRYKVVVTPNPEYRNFTPYPNRPTLASRLEIFAWTPEFVERLELVSTPVTPVPPPDEPITMESLSFHIKSHIIASSMRWNTFWAAALIRDYGPIGYSGPPMQYWNEVWYSRPDQILALGGLENSLEYIRIVVGDGGFEMDLPSGTAFYPNPLEYAGSERATEVLLGYIRDRVHQRNPYGYYLNELLIPVGQAAFRDLTVAFLPVREEVVLGRQTLVVDRLVDGDRLDRLWVDEERGIILGWRQYDEDNPEVVKMDIVLTGFALDFDIPKDFFTNPPLLPRITWKDFWRPNQWYHEPPFAIDPQNEPENGRELGDILPGPTGFDPGQARLSFQWPGEPGSERARIFANQYYLGEADLGDPWNMACERSPDGRKIALIRDPSQPTYASERVSWVDLSKPIQLVDVFPEGIPSSDVAFSPDSQTLAFFGCSAEGNEHCAIYLQNLDSLQTTRLIDMSVVAYFTWSPDGSQLAFIGANRRTNLHLWVVDIGTLAVVYEGPFNWETLQPSPDSPTWGWNTPVIFDSGGLEGCVPPP